MTTRPPRVLVLGDRTTIALAACRALGKSGYDVGATGVGGRDPIRASRYVRRYHAVPAPYRSPDAWRAGILRTIADHEYDVAIASSDAILAAWRDTDLGIPRSPDLRASRARLTDKCEVAQLSVEADVRYPRTLTSLSAAEDAALADRVAGPSVVKVADPTRAGARTSGLPRPKVVTCAADALTAIQRIRSAGGQPVVQRRIRGPKFQAAIIRRDGVSTVRLALRVLREYPSGGAESMLVTLDAEHGVGHEMIAMLERLADAAGYEGVLAAEFIRESDDGQMYLVDPNPRLWGALPFAEMLGMRMTERVVLDALGRRVPPLPPVAPGQRYHHLAREIRWLVARRRNPRGFLRSISLRDAWDVPWLGDVMPELLRLTNFVSDWAGRRR